MLLVLSITYSQGNRYNIIGTYELRKERKDKKKMLCFEEKRRERNETKGKREEKKTSTFTIINIYIYVINT